ncbi:MAG TPA: beta-ketoacyl synthase N-terminal-like domain-containing protein [Bryobacteraceae bacterium]|jgi:acyl transferase domain-containing protein
MTRAGMEPIAIIGMQGRFSGANDIPHFWENLRNGVESITPFTEAELKAAGADPAWLKIPGFVPAGTPLDNLEMFDAQFFGFSPRDAELLDPQLRLLFEIAWESLELAGYDPESFPGRIGVFAGSEHSSYLYQLLANPERLAYADPTVVRIGNEKDYLTTSISYKLNLRGPSVAVQTACSTSLVSVSMACQSLIFRECEMALAGGVTIEVPQKKGYWYMPGGIASPDGHCRTFDAAGQGTVLGNGAGMVVLKRLADALSDGDHIHAVIRGAATNNDGAGKVGFTAPSMEGQAEAIQAAQEMAGFDPETIGYVEAHGTATLLGDPIEVAALREVFTRRSRDGRRKGWCAIGSVKSNLGHLAAAAGAAGLFKTVLSLEKQTLVPSINFQTPNPQIDFANSPFYVNTKLRPWEANGKPRRAGVSSFGVGGTNAHVVLEEAPEAPPSGPSRPRQLILISARTAEALDASTRNLAQHLKAHPDQNLADAAFTTQVGRKAFSHRRVLHYEGSDAAAAAEALEQLEPGRVMTGAAPSADRPVVFMFSGQGSQYVNMGLGLYQCEPDFREPVDQCCEMLRPLLGLDLRAILYPRVGAEPEATARLTRTSLTQPALFTIEYALAQLWMSWGLRLKAMIGHSVGEYVAACLAGVFRLEDALELVAARGRLMETMPVGAMLTVPLSAAEAGSLLNGTLDLAAVNAPYLSVLAGPAEDIERLRAQLNERGLQPRKLETSHAFHSAMMEPILGPFRGLLDSIPRSAPRVPFISNLTGSWITADQAQDPDYWSSHLRSTVQFSAGIGELLRKYSDAVFLETGPGRALETLARQQKAEGRVILSSMRSPREAQPDQAHLLDTLARLWLSGTRIDWRAFSRHERRRRIELPTYPFERQPYWIGPSEKPPPAAEAEQRDISKWFHVPSWRRVSQSHETPPADQRWLVFADSTGIAAALIDELRKFGCWVAAVHPGSEFQAASENEFQIRPGKPADYVALLKATDEPPAVIAHLWTVPMAAESADLGFYSLVHLAQALEKCSVTSPTRIGFVSSGVQSVLGDESLRPHKALALGACKVLPQEHPHLRSSAIDISLDDTDRTATARCLIRELTTEPFEAVVAYRRQRRWVQTFDPLPLPPSPNPPLLRDRGVYLITGGLGNLGLVLAECLARRVRARLVLSGRSILPDRDQWRQWIALNGEEDPVSRKLLRLLAMEELGAEVLVASADSSDLEGMRGVIEQAESRFGQIHGVIHAAGNTSAEGFVPASQLDARVAEAQFQPKVQGTLMLEEVLRGKPLDFRVLTSSISGVLGGLNLLAYASANLFQDAFAASRASDSASPPWISIDWDQWQFPADEALFKTTVPTWKESILPSEGGEAFLRILSRAPLQVVVSATDLEERLNKWVRLESIREKQPGGKGPVSLHPRPNLSSQYVAPSTETEKKVAAAWENLLGVAPVGVHDKFFELGGHSLLAIQLITTIRELFQIEVPPQRLFEAPTVAQFAASIDAALAGAAELQRQTEEQRLSELLEFIDGLSDAEVADLLAHPEGLEQRRAVHG